MSPLPMVARKARGRLLLREQACEKFHDLRLIGQVRSAGDDGAVDVLVPVLTAWDIDFQESNAATA